MPMKKKAKAKKSAKTKAKAAPKKEKKAKKSKAKGERKQRTGTRKAFILETIRAAGGKGIATADLIDKVNIKFKYAEGKSSALRVNNTVREGVESGVLKKSKEGVVSFA